MQRRHQRIKARLIARRFNTRRRSEMRGKVHAEPSLFRETPRPHGAARSSSATTDGAIEFGRFRLLLRRRQLLADGVPVELGTRALDLLLVLLEADGSLVTKQELMTRVWYGCVVSEDNLKVQVSALRRALGADRDVIRTEFGFGYRFTAPLRSDLAPTACQRPPRLKLWAGRSLFSQGYRQSLRCVNPR
jgi:DNA-binding winged helix-turn-helix (wHTH) protein